MDAPPAVRDRPLPRLLALSVVAGSSLAATLPPWGWWGLGPLGAAALWWAVRDQAATKRAIGGATTGVVLYAAGLLWITEFTVPGFLLVVVLEAGILALAVAAVPPGRAQAGGLVAALVMTEAVRGAWPFGGLPLAGIDIGQAGGPLVAGARLGGHLLVVALVATAGIGLAALYDAVRSRAHRAGRNRALAMGGALLAAVNTIALVGSVAPDGSPTGTMSIAAVQGGGARGLRAADSDPGSVFAAHLAASAAVPTPVDVVLWPEDVVDVNGPVAGSAEERHLSELARRLGATVVAGVVEDVEDERFRNAAVAWGPDGRRIARYDKVHRVPFGEYVPARRFFDRLADLSDVPRDAIAGRGPGVLRTPRGRLGVLISYEVFFAARARAAVGAGGTVLLVPTNASSYRRSQVPGQELAVARLRAWETGRWVVQAAPTGYSAVIDHRGRVRHRSALGARAVLSSTVDERTGRTLATRLGDGPLVVASSLWLAGGWGLGERQRRRRDPGR